METRVAALKCSIHFSRGAYIRRHDNYSRIKLGFVIISNIYYT